MSFANHLYTGELLMGSRSFDEMDRMFEQMDRMLDNMWGRVSDRETGLSPWHRSETAFDLHENEAGDGYTLVVDLPGFEKDEIEVRATDSHVMIDATHESEDEHSFQHRNVNERFTIPSDVEIDDVSASYHNGVLQLELPVSGDLESGHRIEIE